ncbi:MAG: hypothetical protein K2X25_10815 [Caulobacteraceae bacterium]|nr:hypothetical protein [Caulobacteraceae bacterium]
MITGRRKTTHFPNAQDAAPPVRLAVPMAVLAVAGSAWAATRIDPGAFTPGAHAEAGEGHEAEGDHEREEQDED